MRYLATLLLFFTLSLFVEPAIGPTVKLGTALAATKSTANQRSGSSPYANVDTEEINNNLVGHSKEEEVYATTNFDDDNSTTPAAQNQTSQVQRAQEYKMNVSQGHNANTTNIPSASTSSGASGIPSAPTSSVTSSVPSTHSASGYNTTKTNSSASTSSGTSGYNTTKTNSSAPSYSNSTKNRTYSGVCNTEQNNQQSVQEDDTFNPNSAPYKNSLRLFQLIPPTIFENTTEGLSEDEKEKLVDTGKAKVWDITSLSNSELIINSHSEYSDTEVTLKLFDTESGDTIIAIGVNSGDSCALELWKSDAKSHITPVAMPPEPPLKDFLGPKKALPPATEVSMQFCLDPLAEGLTVYPLIWSSYGLNQIKLTNEVNYKWNGKDFVKEIVPIAQ